MITNVFIIFVKMEKKPEKEYESAAAVLQMCEYQKQIVENGNKESKKQRRSNNNNVHLTLENDEKSLLNNFLCLLYRLIFDIKVVIW